MPTKVTPVEAQVAPTPEKPVVIEICEMITVAFAQASVLIRDHGYVFSKVASPQTFPTGQAAITLELGTSDTEDAVGAVAASALALARQKAQEHREDLEALQRTRQYEERMAKQAQIATEIEAAKAHLKQLEQAHRTA